MSKRSSRNFENKITFWKGHSFGKSNRQSAFTPWKSTNITSTKFGDIKTIFEKSSSVEKLQKREYIPKKFYDIVVLSQNDIEDFTLYSLNPIGFVTGIMFEPNYQTSNTSKRARKAANIYVQKNRSLSKITSKKIVRLFRLQLENAFCKCLSESKNHI